MLSTILSVFQVIKEIFALIKVFMRYQEEQRIKDSEKKSENRKQATDDLFKAKTEKEFDEASDRLHDNRTW